MSKVISIVSGKGGTGKTAFVANIGALLAMEGNSVCLIDMDMGLRNLDLYLGLENRVVYNVMDVVSGMCRIKQALVRDKRFRSLYMMSASPSRDDRDITSLHMEVLCDRLRNEFDFVIIDGPAGIGDNMDVSVKAADSIVVVVEPETASIRDADVISRELENLGITDKCCVINKVNPELMARGGMPSIVDLSRDIRMDIAGLIQYDDNIHISTNSGVPIVLKLGTYIEKNFSRIAKRITSN